MSKRILFGTSSWGLGHATRDLVLLRALLEAGGRITVVATGQARRVIQSELGERCDYLDWPDMPSTVARTTLGFYGKTVLFIPNILFMWFSEKRRLRRLLEHEPYDLVVSDHRYGLVTDRAPSYFITHSPRYIAPWRSGFMEMFMERFVARWLRPVKKVLIPDAAAADEGPDGGLSGEMSHAARFLPREKMVFLGPLSSIELEPAEKDLDVFISISGPEPQRSRLQDLVLAQVGQLEGRLVVTLGLPGEDPPPPPAEGVEVYAYLDRTQQQAMMNRARLMVCRSGYTTLMELSMLGTPALLIPTPGQTEQLYLADTLSRRGWYHAVRQHELNLPRDVPRARACPGYRGDEDPAAPARRFLAAVLDQPAFTAVETRAPS